MARYNNSKAMGSGSPHLACGGIGLIGNQNGTTDVLENATRWKLQIWSLPKVFNWLESFKKKYGVPRRSSHDPHGGQVCQANFLWLKPRSRLYLNICCSAQACTQDLNPWIQDFN